MHSSVHVPNGKVSLLKLDDLVYSANHANLNHHQEMAFGQKQKQSCHSLDWSCTASVWMHPTKNEI